MRRPEIEPCLFSPRIYPISSSQRGESAFTSSTLDGLLSRSNSLIEFHSAITQPAPKYLAVAIKAKLHFRADSSGLSLTGTVSRLVLGSPFPFLEIAGLASD